jgi:tetratricopeptide (TPR) repeat protein
MANPGEQPNVQEYRQAIARFSDLVEREPYDVRIRTNLAWGYERIGEYPTAVEKFRQALEIDPDSIDAHYGLGLALIGNGEVLRALEELDLARQLARRSEDRSYMVVLQHHVDVFHRRYTPAQ